MSLSLLWVVNEYKSANYRDLLEGMVDISSPLIYCWYRLLWLL